MGIDEVLTKVKATAAKRAADLDGQFWALAKSVAAGREVDPAVVASVLEQGGKSADDFDRAARLMASRFEWAAAVAAEPEADRQRAVAQAAIKTINDALEKARAKAEADAAPHLAAVAQANDASRAASDARDQLRRTNPYPLLLERKKALAADIRAAEGKVKEWQDRVSRVRVNADHPERVGLIDYSASVAAAKERLPIAEKELADRFATRDKLIHDLERLEVEFLTP